MALFFKLNFLILLIKTPKIQLNTRDGAQIGALKKVYAGFVNEMVTTADRFGINCK